MGIRVTGLDRADGRYRLETSAGDRVADQVVVATGAHSTPWRPAFADELDDDILACHSSGYHNPDQLQDGDVLVVGAGNSGTQIATDLSNDGREVWLAGRDTGRLPRRLLGRDIYRWIGPTLHRISRSSFVGRRLFERTADSGDPVFSDVHEWMQAAGGERVGRIVAVDDGRTLAYCEFGSSNGEPVFVFHGGVGSRGFGLLFEEPRGENVGSRRISRGKQAELCTDFSSSLLSKSCLDKRLFSLGFLLS